MNSLVFFSNYFNHHQKALCDAWYALLGEGFTFVETEPMEAFRAQMGWGKEGLPSYVLQAHLGKAERERAMELGRTADAAVIGSAPEMYIEARLAADKLTFRYTERPLKEGFIKFFIPRLTKKYYHLHIKNRKKQLYVLGASAYAAADYRKIGCYLGKCYKFGYFPQVHLHDEATLMAGKEKKDGVPEILWAGRLLKLKRADLLITAAGRLKREGYAFRLRIVGEGEEKERLLHLIEREDLSERVLFQGFQTPETVRRLMEKADIYVMTSNFWEGWGSVIYEALNAGCAVVASHACGCTPWLVRHRETGLVFQSGSVDSLYAQLKELLTHPDGQRRLGLAAYRQMAQVWNPERAASGVLHLADRLAAGQDTDIAEGPCSKAGYLKNNWYTKGGLS